jgi:hypothetical protein
MFSASYQRYSCPAAGGDGRVADCPPAVEPVARHWRRRPRRVKRVWIVLVCFGMEVGSEERRARKGAARRRG